MLAPQASAGLPELESLLNGEGYDAGVVLERPATIAHPADYGSGGTPRR